jgi:ATP-dependent Zn protease
MQGVRRRNVLYAIALAALLVVIVASYQGFKTATAVPEKPLSALLTALDLKQVGSGTFDSGAERVDWTDDHGQVYRTFYPTGYEAVLVDKFHENSSTIVAQRSAGSNILLTVVLPNVILLVLIGGFMWYVLRRYGGKHPPAT